MNRAIPQSTLFYFVLLLFGICGFFLTLFIAPPVGFYGFATVIALGGLGVSTHIYKTKHSGEELVCPAGSNCNRVVNSKYSSFFGVSLEILGILYFFLIAVSYGVLFIAPGSIQGGLLLVVALASTAAALFTLYLVFVQAVLLGEWCIWCVLAAIFSLTLFATSFVTLDQVGVPVHDMVGSIVPFVAFFHYLGYALGVGGATSAAFLFFNFLDDLDISEKELNAIKYVTELIWFGFGLVLVTLLLSSALSPYTAMFSPTFITQIISLFVTAVTGAVLMMFYAPYMMFVPFDSPKPDPANWLSSLRHPTILAGSIALVSWYVSFAMNFTPEIYSQKELFFVYGCILLMAISASYIIEWRLKKRALAQRKG